MLTVNFDIQRVAMINAVDDLHLNPHGGPPFELHKRSSMTGGLFLQEEPVGSTLEVGRGIEACATQLLTYALLDKTAY